MSLITRLGGFGLSLLGAFIMGYVQAVQASVSNIANIVVGAAGQTPNVTQPVIANSTIYFQQNVTPTLNPLLGAAIALAIGGFLLVARGDSGPAGESRRIAPLISRLLGFGLGFLGAWMIGYVQGLQSVIDAVARIFTAQTVNIPNAGVTIGRLFNGYLQQNVNPSQGSFWEFGIILAIGGFILVARGGRRQESPNELPQ